MEEGKEKSRKGEVKKNRGTLNRKGAVVKSLVPLAN